GMAVDHAEVTGGDPARLRDDLGIPAGAPTIGHLATLDPNKGTTDLVRAVARLNADRADDPVHLLLAGPSSPEFEAFAGALPAATWSAATAIPGTTASPPSPPAPTRWPRAARLAAGPRRDDADRAASGPCHVLEQPEHGVADLRLGADLQAARPGPPGGV